MKGKESPGRENENLQKSGLQGMKGNENQREGKGNLKKKSRREMKGTVTLKVKNEKHL